MKKLVINISFFIVIFSFGSVDAQTVYIPKAGDIIINNSLNNYVGDWRWVSGGDTIIIRLKKDRVFFASFNFYCDNLIGFHSYKKSDTLIESNMQYAWGNFSGGYSSILASNGIAGENGNIVEGVISDLSKGKKAHLIKMIFNSAFTEMNLTITHTDGVKFDEIPGMTLPSNLNFIKLPPPPPPPSEERANKLN